MECTRELANISWPLFKNIIKEMQHSIRECKQKGAFVAHFLIVSSNNVDNERFVSRRFSLHNQIDF